MAIHTIEAEVDVKRVYAYVIITDYGWYDDGEDPYDLVPTCSGKKCITIYKFPKAQLEHFEKTVKDYLAKHREYIKWESLGQAIGQYIEGVIFPWKQVEYLFWISGITAKRVYCKSVDYSVNVRPPV